MISTEQKNEMKNSLDQILEDKFQSILVGSKKCFRKEDDSLFMVSVFPGEDSLVVEYADNLFDAKLNRFEDGDRIDLEGVEIETILQQILREVS